MVGDVVRIQDSNQIRGNWKLGQISQVYPDSEGRVRKAEVRYKSTGNNYVTVQRAVQRLIVLLPIEPREQ